MEVISVIRSAKITSCSNILFRKYYVYVSTITLQVLPISQVLFHFAGISACPVNFLTTPIKKVTFFLWQQ
ncbi:hypothetical protein PROVRETT_09394 [Providencia rettgeri DSM 1131]|nr:hypothetical protein PROVRETT_09394 [Providencia rettgeri DSM 1131]